MPATYAHCRFGKAVLSRLDENTAAIIKKDRQLFDIGLHGPDILFYYRPLLPNRVSKTGYSMHDRAGTEFFENAAAIVGSQGDKSPYLAYTYGFICHFALDRACHGYIDRKIKSSTATHIEIEGEFDRALLVEDGYDPLSKSLCGHIVPSERSSEIISRFFDGIAPKQVYKALRSYNFYCGLFLAPGRVKRGAITAALKICGLYKSLHGMMMNKTADPVCEDSCKLLRSLFDQAVPQAAMLINEFERSARGELDWNGLYRYTFGSERTDGGESEQ